MDGRRDPNGPLANNWQRKMLMADRIPIPDMESSTFEDSQVHLADGTSFKQGDFVFVAWPTDALHHPNTIIENWGAPPPAFRIARILELRDSHSAKVNWLLRPDEVFYKSEDTRELFLSFSVSCCQINQFRGKCTVQNRLEVRNFDKFREHPSNFWFSRFFHSETQHVYDVLPVSILKNLAEEKLQTKYIIVEPSKSAQLLVGSSKPRGADAETGDSEWPFCYYNTDTKTLMESLPESKPKVGDGHQVQVDDWPGHSLVYYTMGACDPSSGRTVKPRLVEPAEDDEVDESLPWVQEMPKGYLARGSSATATPISIPQPRLAEFIDTCREKVAPQTEVEPYNLNFLDACCSSFVNGNFDEALSQATRFNKKELMEPQLNKSNSAKFRELLSPFARNSWHSVFKQMNNIPIAELTQYLWVNMPHQQWIPAEQLQWENDPTEEETDFTCAVCSTEVSQEWKALPGYLPLDSQSRKSQSDRKYAMCIRCARLWYRYKTGWIPSAQVERLISGDSPVEPELVADSKSFISEEQKRSKRRKAAQEKKDQATIKRLEAKRAKIEKKMANAKDSKAESDHLAAVEKIDQEIKHLSALGNEDHSDKETQEEDSKPLKTAKDPPKKRKTPVKQEPKAKKAKVEVPIIEDANIEEDDSSADEGRGVHNHEEDEEEVEEEEGGEKKLKARGRGSRLSLDMADQIVSKINDESALEISNEPDYCVICGQLDPSMEQYTCYFCKLNVHAACYGTRPYNGLIWKCDCCANLHGLTQLDLNYQCALCPIRYPTYGQWLNGSEEEHVPDALKGTVDGIWCHARCAVWTPGVTYTNPTQFLGVNTTEIPKKLFEGKCSICMKRAATAESAPKDDRTETAGAKQLSDKQNGTQNDKPDSDNTITLSSDKPNDRQSGVLPASEKSSNEKQPAEKQQYERPSVDKVGGESHIKHFDTSRALTHISAATHGSKVKCDLCDEIFHVCCAADAGYQLGFTKESIPRAVIVCSKHGDSDIELTPMSMVDIKTNQTAMQIYVQTQKLDYTGLVPSGVSRAAEAHKRDRLLVESNDFKGPRLLSVVVPANKTDHIRVEDRHISCADCGSNEQSYWLCENNSVKCSACYRNTIEHVNKKLTTKIEEPEVTPMVEKYTELFLKHRDVNPLPELIQYRQ